MRIFELFGERELKQVHNDICQLQDVNKEDILSNIKIQSALIIKICTANVLILKMQKKYGIK